MAISITPSPFGSVTVTLDGELGGVLSVSVLATSNSALNMDLGVPGPAGATGATGATGQGVAAGGTTGQALVKLSNSDYATTWATISSSAGTWGSITGTLSNQTDLQNALNGKLSLTGGTMTGTIFLPSLRNLLNTDLTVTAYNDTGAGTNFVHTFDAFDGTFALATNGGGLKFPDATVQVTAYDPAVLGNYLPLTGGTVTGAINYGVYAENENNVVLNSGGLTVQYDTNNYRTIIGTGSISMYEDATQHSMYINPSSGITFPDSSVQNTAGLPLTGGQMSGDSAFIRMDSVGAGNTRIELSPDENRATFTNLEVQIAGSASIKFADDTYQTTAFPGYSGTTSDYIRGNGSTAPFPSIPVFPPSGGTTSQYIRGDGSVATYGPLGDRYFTTSNSTLTCDSGDGKTMTIGTGLSYSRQQDITVSYNNANHMHGTVLTYDSVTGVMTFDSNTHSGSGTYSSWEVNVGGVAGAVLPVGGTASQVLAKVNSTNFNTEWISLGSMATQPASAYLSTASAVANYLTISSASSTYQTQSGMSAYLSTASAVANYQTIAGMSAYLSTSAAASTYQTQSGMSAYLSTASASANFIGTSAYATTAQAQAGTSTTTVVSPATLLDAKLFAGYKVLNAIVYSSATSGTGAASNQYGSNGRLLTAPTSATGNALYYSNVSNSVRGGSLLAGFDWTKRFTFGARLCRNVVTPDSNSVFRYILGKTTSTIGDLSSRGIEIKVAGTGALQLLVHNGTTLTTTTSTYTPSNAVAYDVTVISDGAGNVTLYVNGSSVATSTGGPTTTVNFGCYTQFEVENTSSLTNGAMSVCVSDIFIQSNI